MLTIFVNCRSQEIRTLLNSLEGLQLKWQKSVERTDNKTKNTKISFNSFSVGGKLNSLCQRFVAMRLECITVINNFSLPYQWGFPILFV